MAQLACSVVIVSYFTSEALFECLAALFADQRENVALDVVVVDNGNPQRHSKRLSAFAAVGDIQWIRGHGNIGFAAGCNLGVHHARTETILLLNPDCIAQSGAVSELYDFLCQQSHQTVASGWVTNPDGSEQRGLRRNLLTPWSLLIEILPVIKRLPVLRNQQLNLTQLPISGEVIAVGACSGACMMMPKSLFEALDGMDEGYFLHVDDLDFCRRLADIGGQVRIYRRAVFSHYQGTSIASNHRVARYKRASFIRYFSRHHRLFWHSPLGWGLRLAIDANYYLSRKHKTKEQASGK